MAVLLRSLVTNFAEKKEAVTHPVHGNVFCRFRLLKHAASVVLRCQGGVGSSAHRLLHERLTPVGFSCWSQQGIAPIQASRNQKNTQIEISSIFFVQTISVLVINCSLIVELRSLCSLQCMREE
jgi:hypothetical protein